MSGVHLFRIRPTRDLYNLHIKENILTFKYASHQAKEGPQMTTVAEQIPSLMQITVSS